MDEELPIKLDSRNYKPYSEEEKTNAIILLKHVRPTLIGGNYPSYSVSKIIIIDMMIMCNI